MKFFLHLFISIFTTTENKKELSMYYVSAIKICKFVSHSIPNYTVKRQNLLQKDIN